MCLENYILYLIANHDKEIFWMKIGLEWTINQQTEWRICLPIICLCILNVRKIP